MHAPDDVVERLALRNSVTRARYTPVLVCNGISDAVLRRGAEEAAINGNETPAGHCARVGCIFPDNHGLEGNPLMNECMSLTDLSHVAMTTPSTPVNMFKFGDDVDDTVSADGAYWIGHKYTEEEFGGIFTRGHQDPPFAKSGALLSAGLTCPDTSYGSSRPSA